MMLSSSSSSSSATVRVEKATSSLLIGPDWTMNIDICDSINSNHWQAKDVVKAVKKRLQHKNPKVQLLALTLLETMVKNCGDYVHFQIVEKNILQEMIKIVKKKSDMHVRDKILVLLDSWQEAFGGPGGKHPHYYWAYEELRRFGVEFPQRSLGTAPIFTPPATHPTLTHPQAGYGMPRNSSTRLDEAMAAEMETLSLSSINSMRNVLDLLADMLQAVNPSDRVALKDEVIVDLVAQCRANQRKLMQMLTTTGDEELLAQGLELNDTLQSVLAKHDAIASGSPLPTQVTNFNTRTTEVHNSSPRPTEIREPVMSRNANPSAPVVTTTRSQIEEEEEEEDDFAQLARRHSKTRTIDSLSESVNSSNGMASSAPTPVPNNALALLDPPSPIRTTKEQDMIDLLSLTLSTTTTDPDTPQSSTAPTQNTHNAPVSPTTHGYPYPSQIPVNSYIVPWAQPPSQSQPPPPSPPPPQPQPVLQPQPQNQYTQYSSGLPPPPWATTPGYFNNQTLSRTPYTYANPQANTSMPYMPAQGARGSNWSAMNGDERAGSNTRTSAPTPAPAVGQKPYVPSYRLFEDLNVLGNSDGRFKMKSSATPSVSGTSNQSMVGGRK